MSVEMASWIDVCGLDEIVPDTGVCALIGDRQVAIVRLSREDRVHALDNHDPKSGAYVLSRGIVGDRAGRAKIASPLYKHSYDLETGACMDDPDVQVAVYPARVRDGRVEVLL